MKNKEVREINKRYKILKFKNSKKNLSDRYKNLDIKSVELS